MKNPHLTFSLNKFKLTRLTLTNNVVGFANFNLILKQKTERYRQTDNKPHKHKTINHQPLKHKITK